MDYYSGISEGYDELHKEEQLKKIKKVIELLKIKDNEKVLDVGCGTALYSGYFKDYIGIDKSKGMLSKTKSKVVLGEAENLPFKDKSFDTVISITAIHNFNDPEKAIKEIKRVSKNKIAITAIHNFEDPEKAIEEIKRVSKNKIAITILKKSKKLKEISNLLKDFDNVEEDKDVIFYRKWK